MEKERILILCVDRDDDIGQKTGIKGPIIGRENALKTAIQLALSDPEESDSNAIFGAIKLYDEMRNRYSVEVAILTGSQRRGIDADMEISRQIDKIVKNSSYSSIIFVTDGKDDEVVLPIIESRIPVLSVRRVIIRQSSQLESGYYKLKDFIRESLENPRVSMLLFGIPAISFIIYSLFESFGYRIIMGIVGLYLFIKGFQLEKFVGSMLKELEISFEKRKLSFLFYLLSILIFLFALFRGYNDMLGWLPIGFFESLASFLLSSIYLLWISASIAWIGKIISSKHFKFLKLFPIPLFMFSISIVIYNASKLILDPNYSLLDFIIAITVGFITAFFAILVERFVK